MKMIQMVAIVALLMAASIAGAQPFENSSVVGQVPDRIVITVKPDTQMALDKAGGAKVGVPGLDALADRFEIKGMEQLYAGMTDKLSSKSHRELAERVWAVDFPERIGIDVVEAAYKALPEVEEVRRVDICRNFAYLPNDVSSQQYYLRNLNLGGASIRAVGAWNQTLGDSNVIVCVLDSGVDWQHPDLGGSHPDKVNGAIWTNWTEYNGTPGVDDDGNGKIDDIRGWDFVTGVNGYPDEDNQTPDNDPSDYESHGTNCAGCVAAITNNGIGIAGTAPGCKIMPVRVGYLPNGETGGVVRMDFVAQGMVYAANNGAKIINCSWGSTSYLTTAVSIAQGAGCLLVTAAGNDNISSSPSYLGTRSGVLAVAATNQSDGKASFSNYGAWVEISAPGVGIYTTAYNASTQTSTYASVNGTSFSSPITAGAAALVWSANPTMNYSQVYTLLRSTTDNIDDLNPGYAGELGTGRVNMLKALGDTQHRYPSEFPTLFDALNEAAEGDEIAIEGGVVLNAPITLPRKDVQLLGGYSGDYGSRDPLGNPSVVSGTLGVSGIRFLEPTTAATVIDGFEIRDCGGQSYGGIPYNALYGGGITLNRASPTLRNLLITGNDVGSSGDLGCGGGLNANESTATLENVTITGNSAVLGAALFAFESDLTLTNCVFDANTPITTNASQAARGGGIHLVDSDITLIDCRISGHTETVQGGGIFGEGLNTVSNVTMTGGEVSGNTARDQGGGIYLNGGALNLSKVQITDNGPATTATFMYGGGLYTTGATADLDSLTVSGNSAQVGAGAMLGGPQIDVRHSLFHLNAAAFFAGGLGLDTVTGGTIENNTITGNSGLGAGGAGLYLTNATADVSNNIVAFNTGGGSFGNGVAASSASSVFTCNDIYGNDAPSFTGIADPTGTDGNIAADPQFCDVLGGDFTIAPSSPCAAAQSGACGLIGAFEASCGGSPVEEGPEGELPLAFHVERNFPNPFNPKTTIRFTLPEAGMTKVAIFDVAGRHIKTLVQEELAAKSHEITWQGRDAQDRRVAAGVYFYQVTSGSHQAVGRMALVK